MLGVERPEEPPGVACGEEELAGGVEHAVLEHQGHQFREVRRVLFGVGHQVGAGQTRIDVQTGRAEGMVVKPDGGCFLGVGVAVDGVVGGCGAVPAVVGSAFENAGGTGVGEPGVGTAIELRGEFTTVQMHGCRDRRIAELPNGELAVVEGTRVPRDRRHRHVRAHVHPQVQRVGPVHGLVCAVLVGQNVGAACRGKLVHELHLRGDAARRGDDRADVGVPPWNRSVRQLVRRLSGLQVPPYPGPGIAGHRASRKDHALELPHAQLDLARAGRDKIQVRQWIDELRYSRTRQLYLVGNSCPCIGKARCCKCESDNGSE